MLFIFILSCITFHLFLKLSWHKWTSVYLDLQLRKNEIEKKELLAIVVWQKAYPILQRDHNMNMPDIIICKQEVSRESFTDRKCVLFRFLRFIPVWSVQKPVSLSRSESHCRKDFTSQLSALSVLLCTAYRCAAQVCVHACMPFRWADG